MENVNQGSACAPDTPAPGTNEPHMCDGTLRIECCCPKMMTRTFIVDIGPQDLASLSAFLSGTVSNYEAQNYTVLAHSLTDTGAGWLLGLTIGWYA